MGIRECSDSSIGGTVYSTIILSGPLFEHDGVLYNWLQEKLYALVCLNVNSFFDSDTHNLMKFAIRSAPPLAQYAWRLSTTTERNRK